MKRLQWSVFLIILAVSCKQSPQPTKESTSSIDKKWWKEAVLYQIYPRSFKDSDGDGIGDLKGIIEKLDYIKSLGVDVVWLNPIYKSPNDDNGYDVSDYRDIMTDFGTMADFDEMLQGFHDRGIKLVLDLVVNHSSDEHEWFKQSRSSRDNPYRDYYHWWPAENGKPVPRWSYFDENGDAWRYDSTTNAYYLHIFSRKQPDLKWENPKVRKEVHDIMKFWLDKGIDGFRMDVFHYISKDTTWPVYPEGYEKNLTQYYSMGPNLHTYLQEMNREVISQYDIMTVAEGAGRNFNDAHNLVDADRKELSMAYHFEVMDIWKNPDNKSLLEFKNIFTRWDSAFADKGWLSIFLANHDVPRMVSKFGNDSPEYRALSSKMLNTFILSMRGTPYCYHGDEIGMTNIGFDKMEDYRDLEAINHYKYVEKTGGDLDAFMAKLKDNSRDNCRTPFQWDTTENSGFTTGTPWIKVNPNYRSVNVAVEEKDPNSCLNYFRKMVQLRKQHPVLVYGRYKILDRDNPNIYAYTRTDNKHEMIVLLNFTSSIATAHIGIDTRRAKVLISNYPEHSIAGQENGSLTLRPYEAIILKQE